MKPQRRLVVVLGMHRGGTSATTRGLKALGVTLGDNFLPVMPEVNEKGFWEDQDFHAINIELLRLLDAKWYTNRRIAPSRFEGDDIVPLILQAADLINRKIAAGAVFGFKDPRTAILLPFWKKALSRTDVDISYVIAVRHPKSVAESLWIRDGIASPKAYALWLAYTLPTILQTCGQRRVVVDYDLLLDHPADQLRRVARALDLDSGDEAAIAHFAEDFLSANLRHSRHGAGDLADDPAVPSRLVEVFSTMQLLARDEESVDSAAVHESLADAERFLDDLAPFLGYIDSLEDVCGIKALYQPGPGK